MNERTLFKVLGAISFTYFLNDTMQSLMIASYPLFKSDFELSCAQIGLLTLSTLIALLAMTVLGGVGVATRHHLPRG